MRTRNWSIRSRIIALIAVPLAALLALWIFATTLTAGPALNLLSAQTLLDTVGNPGEVLMAELQHERKLSVAYLSSPDVSHDTLTTQREVTDKAAADFRRAAGSRKAQNAASDALRTRISQMFTDLDGLPDNRDHIDAREVDPAGAQGLYNTVIDTGYQMFSATATVDDERIGREYRALNAVGRGQEYLSRADSLLGAATTGGKFTEDIRDQLIQVIGTADYLFGMGVADLPDQDRAAFQRLSTGPAYTSLRRLQDELITQSRVDQPSPVSAQSWQPVYDTAAQELRVFELTSTAALAQRAKPVGYNILIRLGIAGIVGLVALIISVVVSVKVGRSIVGRLVRLRGDALEIANERLPMVVRRLQRGETVDVAVETPPMEYGTDEIGQLGHAFNEVQRTAVQSAVDEASVRRGINDVFLNIARRSQTLLHRQLALLDRMERREAKPEELEDLYRVDHLATRMRRHAEDLVILAGAAPGRGWRNPVPIIDVIRGAISEVEDYKRVDIRAVEPSAVLGRAVGDVIHLLAELLENATSFSPPHTRVLVAGQVLPNGYAIEIEDRGLGMTAEAMIGANRRLLEPPEFDPANSARLGLFVVAQLASRHGILISLRPSAFGGVTAIVLIPAELVTVGTGQMALPSGLSRADRLRDQPLVGTGTDDPSRHSLAALQWQSSEPLHSVTSPGRHVTINGIAASNPAGAVPLQRRSLNERRTAEERKVPSGFPAPEEPSAAERGMDAGGPMPSAVAETLSPDGLVQRRRTAPRRAPAPPAGRPRPQDLAEAAAALAEKPPPAAPVSPAPTGRRAVLDLSTPDGLPRRIRQASLAPQLRKPLEDDQEDTVPLRSPEQVRDLMSALQMGTTRGRRAAQANGPEASRTPGQIRPAAPDPAATPDRPTRDGERLAEAATVVFPALRHRAQPRGNDDENHANGPDKESQ